MSARPLVLTSVPHTDDRRKRFEKLRGLLELQGYALIETDQGAYILPRSRTIVRLHSSGPVKQVTLLQGSA